jgi:hypothetical protein
MIMKKSTKKTITKSEISSNNSEDQFKGLLSKEDAVRSTAFNEILSISENSPEILYPKWDFFVHLLESDNNYRKYIGLYILANLTKIDSDNRFETMFDAFFKHLSDDSVMIASHLAKVSGIIARNKPLIQKLITQKLLKIDTLGHTPQHRDQIKAYAVEAFDIYFQDVDDTEKKAFLNLYKH